MWLPYILNCSELKEGPAFNSQHAASRIKLTERKGWCLHICENKITDFSTSDCVNFIYVCMYIYMFMCVYLYVHPCGGQRWTLSVFNHSASTYSEPGSLNWPWHLPVQLVWLASELQHSISASPDITSVYNHIQLFTWVLGVKELLMCIYQALHGLSHLGGPLRIFLKALICQGCSRQGNAGSLITLGARSLKEFRELMNFIMLWLCVVLFEVNGILCMVI